MKIFFVTIVKDGMPFIGLHYPMMRQLPFDWTWNVIEGTAAPEACTSWCAPMPPGLSTDGTTELLDSLATFDKRVRVFRHAYWHGKTAMLNAALEWLHEPCLLWQIDADEIWNLAQIQAVVALFDKDLSKRNCARFFCRYFVGQDVVITSRNGYGNNTGYEWNRVWKVEPGVRFKTHEPPCLEKFEERPFTHEQTEDAGAVFDHYAYATEAQVKFKSAYYGSTANKAGHLYRNAVEGWKRLQANQKWPVDLREFLPWVGNNVSASRL